MGLLNNFSDKDLINLQNQPPANQPQINPKTTKAPIWEKYAISPSVEDCLQARDIRRKGVIKTGLAGLDKALGGGLVPGLHFLAGCPGAGKTALIGQIADYTIMQQNNIVCFVSLEMDATQLKERGAIRYCNQFKPQTLSNLQNLSPAEYCNILAAYDRAIGRRLLLITPTDLNDLAAHYGFKDEPAEMPNHIATLFSLFEDLQKCDHLPSLLIIDYFQRLRGYDDKDERQRLEAQLKDINDLAQRFKITILAVSQMTESGSFKGTINFSFDACTLMTLNILPPPKITKTAGDRGTALAKGNERRQYYKDNNINDYTPILLNIDKNRYGKPGDVCLKFLGANVIFQDAPATISAFHREMHLIPEPEQPISPEPTYNGTGMMFGGNKRKN